MTRPTSATEARVRATLTLAAPERTDSPATPPAITEVAPGSPGALRVRLDNGVVALAARAALTSDGFDVDDDPEADRHEEYGTRLIVRDRAHLLGTDRAGIERALGAALADSHIDTGDARLPDVVGSLLGHLPVTAAAETAPPIGAGDEAIRAVLRAALYAYLSETEHYLRSSPESVRADLPTAEEDTCCPVHRGRWQQRHEDFLRLETRRQTVRAALAIYGDERPD